jgi:hypothetical protein
LLTLAVGSAQTRRVADAWAWTRKSTIDISPLVAASLALFGAQTLSPVEDVDEPKPLVAY